MKISKEWNQNERKTIERPKDKMERKKMNRGKQVRTTNNNAIFSSLKYLAWDVIVRKRKKRENLGVQTTIVEIEDTTQVYLFFALALELYGFYCRWHMQKVHLTELIKRTIESLTHVA